MGCAEARCWTWSPRTSLPVHGSLGTRDVLICGAPPMVWATVERLRPLGLVEARTRSDVFDYARATISDGPDDGASPRGHP